MRDNFIIATVFLLNLDTPLFFPISQYYTTGMTTAATAATISTIDNNNNVNKT